jgi:hypothetical protein
MIRCLERDADVRISLGILRRRSSQASECRWSDPSRSRSRIVVHGWPIERGMRGIKGGCLEDPGGVRRLDALRSKAVHQRLGLVFLLQCRKSSWSMLSFEYFIHILITRVNRRCFGQVRTPGMGSSGVVLQRPR